MSKKIVAIGGGDNGRLRLDGTRTNYETYSIDEEIKKLTNKKNPNYLLGMHKYWKIKMGIFKR